MSCKYHRLIMCQFD